MAVPTGSADIFTTEYMDEEEIGYERSCSSMCGGDEQRPLLPDTADVTVGTLGRGHYPRLVARSGETNVVHFNSRSRKILTQMGFMFHVLIGMRAWKLVILFFMSYLVSYFVIGAVLWFSHDMSEFHGIHTYFEAVVFTGYTMTTVGFGNQYPTNPAASILPLCSVVLSLLMDAFWLGVIFARISSPRPLRHTVLFSKSAVMYNESEQACYLFSCRMINLRLRYPWVDLSVKMTLSLYEPKTQSFEMHDLKVEENGNIFFDLPWDIKHLCTNDSPLQQALTNPAEFDRRRGEIILELNGQDPLTGNCMKKRFSYCAHEVLRDRNFVCIVSSGGEEGYSVDLTQFHNTEAATGIYGAIATKPTTDEAGAPIETASVGGSTNQV